MSIEWGLHWTCSDGREFTACGYTEAGARRTAEAITGRSSSLTAELVQRTVGEWVPVGEDQK